jgi:hypothetical protein
MTNEIKTLLATAEFMQRRDGHINDVKGTHLVARMFGGLGIFVNPSIHPSIHPSM